MEIIKDIDRALDAAKAAENLVKGGRPEPVKAVAPPVVPVAKKVAAPVVEEKPTPAKTTKKRRKT